MKKKEARAFRHRWRLANDVERRERRRLSLEEKLRAIDQCYQTAVALGLLKRYAAVRRRGAKEVRERWRRLKDLAA
jgi:hypothetical protein